MEQFHRGVGAHPGELQGGGVVLANIHLRQGADDLNPGADHRPVHPDGGDDRVRSIDDLQHRPARGSLLAHGAVEMAGDRVQGDPKRQGTRRSHTKAAGAEGGGGRGVLPRGLGVEHEELVQAHRKGLDGPVTGGGTGQGLDGELPRDLAEGDGALPQGDPEGDLLIPTQGDRGLHPDLPPGHVGDTREVGEGREDFHRLEGGAGRSAGGGDGLGGAGLGDVHRDGGLRPARDGDARRHLDVEGLGSLHRQGVADPQADGDRGEGGAEGFRHHQLHRAVDHRAGGHEARRCRGIAHQGVARLAAHDGEAEHEAHALNQGGLIRLLDGQRHGRQRELELAGGLGADGVRGLGDEGVGREVVLVVGHRPATDDAIHPQGEAMGEFPRHEVPGVGLHTLLSLKRLSVERAHSGGGHRGGLDAEVGLGGEVEGLVVDTAGVLGVLDAHVDGEAAQAHDGAGQGAVHRELQAHGQFRGEPAEGALTPGGLEAHGGHVPAHDHVREDILGDLDGVIDAHLRGEELARDIDEVEGVGAAREGEHVHRHGAEHGAGIPASGRGHEELQFVGDVVADEGGHRHEVGLRGLGAVQVVGDLEADLATDADRDIADVEQVAVALEVLVLNEDGLGGGPAELDRGEGRGVVGLHDDLDGLVHPALSEGLGHRRDGHGEPVGGRAVGVDRLPAIPGEAGAALSHTEGDGNGFTLGGRGLVQGHRAGGGERLVGVPGLGVEDGGLGGIRKGLHRQFVVASGGQLILELPGIQGPAEAETVHPGGVDRHAGPSQGVAHPAGGVLGRQDPVVVGREGAVDQCGLPRHGELVVLVDDGDGRAGRELRAAARGSELHEDRRREGLAEAVGASEDVDRGRGDRLHGRHEAARDSVRGQGVALLQGDGAAAVVAPGQGEALAPGDDRVGGAEVREAQAGDRLLPHEADTHRGGGGEPVLGGVDEEVGGARRGDEPGELVEAGAHLEGGGDPGGGIGDREGGAGHFRQRGVPHPGRGVQEGIVGGAGQGVLHPLVGPHRHRAEERPGVAGQGGVGELDDQRGGTLGEGQEPPGAGARGGATRDRHVHLHRPHVVGVGVRGNGEAQDGGLAAVREVDHRRNVGDDRCRADGRDSGGDRGGLTRHEIGASHLEVDLLPGVLRVELRGEEDHRAGRRGGPVLRRIGVGILAGQLEGADGGRGHCGTTRVLHVDREGHVLDRGACRLPDGRKGRGGGGGGPGAHGTGVDRPLQAVHLGLPAVVGEHGVHQHPVLRGVVAAPHAEAQVASLGAGGQVVGDLVGGRRLGGVIEGAFPVGLQGYRVGAGRSLHAAGGVFQRGLSHPEVGRVVAVHLEGEALGQAGGRNEPDAGDFPKGAVALERQRVQIRIVGLAGDRKAIGGGQVGDLQDGEGFPDDHGQGDLHHLAVLGVGLDDHQVGLGLDRDVVEGQVGHGGVTHLGGDGDGGARVALQRPAHHRACGDAFSLHRAQRAGGGRSHLQQPGPGLDHQIRLLLGGEGDVRQRHSIPSTLDLGYPKSGAGLHLTGWARRWSWRPCPGLHGRG